MNKKEQEIIDLTIRTLFENYGEINKLEADKNTIVYSFLCDSKKVFKKEDFLYYMGII